MSTKLLRIRNILAIFLFVILLTSCRNKTKWFNYNCKWECPEYNFYLGKQGSTATLTYNEETYTFTTGKSNNATYIKFYIPNGKKYVENYSMKANTTYKNDILYLEFTEDEIADFVGKTLEFRKVIEE